MRATRSCSIGNNALDFDDLLMETVQLFQEHPAVLLRDQRFYDHILVDEFQDTNTVQYALLRQLAEINHNLYAVGDPDQSIYRWRGADYRNVRRFRKTIPTRRRFCSNRTTARRR